MWALERRNSIIAYQIKPYKTISQLYLNKQKIMNQYIFCVINEMDYYIV